MQAVQTHRAGRGQNEQSMQSLIEKTRGYYAILRWFVGVPLMGLRMQYQARDKAAALAMVARQSERFLRTCRINVSVAGDIPPPGNPCVVCYNETSIADVFVLTANLLHIVDRVAAADLYGKMPFMGKACEKIDFEMVPRGNRAKTDLLVDKVVAAVKGGDRLAWGGEGRLSGLDGVSRFKIGAGLIAIRAGVPIVPVAVFGGHQCLPLGSFRARPGQVSIQIGTPISTKGLTVDDARDLVDRVQAVVAGMYADLRRAAGIEDTPAALALA